MIKKHLYILSVAIACLCMLGCNKLTEKPTTNTSISQNINNTDIKDFDIYFEDGRKITSSELGSSEKNSTHIIDIINGKKSNIKFNFAEDIDSLPYTVEQDNDNISIKKYSDGINIEAKKTGVSTVKVIFDNSTSLSLNVNIKPDDLLLSATHYLELDKKTDVKNSEVTIFADGLSSRLEISSNNEKNNISYSVNEVDGLIAKVEKNNIYISTLKSGTYLLDIVAKTNTREYTYQLKINALNPKLNVKVNDSAIDNIYLNDKELEIGLNIENLNPDRVYFYREQNSIEKSNSNIVEYNIKYDEEYIDIISDSVEKIYISPKKTGKTNITVAISVDGYEEFSYTKEIEILPPQARFNLTDENLIDIDKVKAVRYEYDITDDTNIELIYDEDNLHINKGNKYLTVKGLRESSGEIKVRAYGDGLSESTTTIPYRVTKDKIRLNITKEKIPNTLKRNITINIGAIPENASISCTVSDSSILNAEIDNGGLRLSPLKDGEVKLTFSVTAKDYEEFIIEKDIYVDCPDIILSVKDDSIELNEGEKITVAIKKAPISNMDLSIKVTNDNICLAELNQANNLNITAKAVGETEIVIEGTKKGYTPYTLIIPVSVGEKKTPLKISGIVEAYPDFIGEISYEVGGDNSAIAYTASEEIEVLSFNEKSKKGKLKFKARDNGTVTFTATSSDNIPNVKVCSIYYTNKSTSANGMNILYKFDENPSYTVYNHNLTMRNLFNLEPTNEDKYPKTTGENLVELTETVNKIIANKNTDREKAFAIYKWITNNIYYDFDGLNGKSELPTTAYEVYKNRRGICDGYSSLYSDMCRIAGIPARKIEGQYEYGDKKWENGTVNTHAWNEVWIDGRWAIVDSTWGTYLRYENATYDSSGGVDGSYRFFDPSLQRFSLDHRIDLVVHIYS